MSHRRRTAIERAALRSLAEQRDATLAHDCDDLARSMGWRVRSFSQHTRSIIVDLPDRLYTHRARGLGLWFDHKSSTDRLTRGQASFLLDQLAAGHPAACGDLDVLTALLQCRDRLSLIRRATDVTQLAIAQCARRFRGETIAEAATLSPP